MKTSLLKRRSSGISGWVNELEDSGIEPVYERIYRVVRQIPRGKVATYGQVARIVDRCTARMVGYSMAALRGRTDVPWQRVINAKGEISTRSRGDGALRQRKLLENEGIHFDSNGRVNLRKVRWGGSKAGFPRKPPMEKELKEENDSSGRYVGCVPRTHRLKA